MNIYLLPNLLSKTGSPSLTLPEGVAAIVNELDGLIAESAKEGRAFLKRFLIQRKVADIPLMLLNEHTQEEEIETLLKEILKGQKWALVSDAGLPCMADPGARLVARAKKAGIIVHALPGPCSLVLALMLSGFSAQRFAFHGYLPRDREELANTLRLLQQRARLEKETQLFIETPYRNERLFAHLLQHLGEEILLCIACDLTSPTEEVHTMSIKEWKANPLPKLDNRPAVFLFASKSE